MEDVDRDLRSQPTQVGKAPEVVFIVVGYKKPLDADAADSLKVAGWVEAGLVVVGAVDKHRVAIVSDHEGTKAVGYIEYLDLHLFQPSIRVEHLVGILSEEL
jgi:hypothetical protein